MFVCPSVGSRVRVLLHDGHTGVLNGRAQDGVVESVNPFGVPRIAFADGTTALVELSRLVAA